MALTAGAFASDDTPENFFILEPTLRDVFLTSDSKILIRATQQSSCSVISPQDAEDIILNYESANVYRADIGLELVEGDWSVQCTSNTTAAVQNVSFRVDNHAHGKMFLKGSSLGEFRTKFNHFFNFDTGEAKLKDEWIAFCKKYWFGEKVDLNFALDETYRDWPSACFFYVQMNIGSSDVHKTIPNGSTPKNYGSSFVVPAVLYLTTGNPDYLTALKQNIDYILRGGDWRYLVYNVFSSGDVYQKNRYTQNAACPENYTTVYEDAENKFWVKLNNVKTLVSVSRNCIQKVAGMLSDLDRTQWLTDLTMTYDLVYTDLSISERRNLRDRIISEAKNVIDDYLWDFSCIKVTSFTDGALTDCYNYKGYYNRIFHKDGTATNFIKRMVNNGHPWIQYGSVGMALYTMFYEMDQEERSYRDKWLDAVEEFFKSVFDGQYKDGAGTNGFSYFSYDAIVMVQYLEARRSFTDDESLYDRALWLKNSPNYLLYLTLPNDQRINFEDSKYGDFASLSSVMEVIANVYSNPIAQRLAWQGHSPAEFTASRLRRDLMELFWYNNNIIPKQSLSDVATHKFFDEYGVVSLRTGWGKDDTVFVYKAGPFTGGHEDPAAGTFVLFSRGTHLVTEPGKQDANPYKRTGEHSTLFVDGFGQHREFVMFGDANPEGSNAKITSFLANKKEGFDVVSIASNLTTAYKWDEEYHRSVLEASHLVNQIKYSNTNVSDLKELSRFVVWLEGKVILLLDRFHSDLPHRYDWKLLSRRFVKSVQGLDVPLDEFDDVASGYDKYCQVKDDGNGFYFWQDESEAPIFLRLTKERAWDDYLGVEFKDGTKCTRFASDGNFCYEAYQKLNQDLFVPTVDANDKNCASPFELDGFVATVSQRDVSGQALFDGALKILTLDDSKATLKTAPTFHNTGETVKGYHLNRFVENTTQGHFLTALLPYSVSSDAESNLPTVRTLNDVEHGDALLVEQGQKETFVVLSKESINEVSFKYMKETTAYDVKQKGDLGVMLFDADYSLEYPRVVQLTQGKSLKLNSEMLIESSADLSIGLEYSQCEVTGQIRFGDLVTQTTLKLGTTDMQLDKVNLNGVAIGSVYDNGVLTIDLSKEGTLVISSSLSDCKNINQKVSSTSQDYPSQVDEGDSAVSTTEQINDMNSGDPLDDSENTAENGSHLEYVLSGGCSLSKSISFTNSQEYKNPISFILGFLGLLLIFLRLKTPRCQ